MPSTTTAAAIQHSDTMDRIMQAKTTILKQNRPMRLVIEEGTNLFAECKPNTQTDIEKRAAHQLPQWIYFKYMKTYIPTENYGSMKTRQRGKYSKPQ